MSGISAKTARASKSKKGAIGRNQSRAQRFVVRFPSITDSGGVIGPERKLVAEISDGTTVWLRPIVSIGGAPAWFETIGGANPPAPSTRLPNTAIVAVYEELLRLWGDDDDRFPVGRILVMAAGFKHRPLRPYQPGKPPGSHELVAVRARRLYSDRERRPVRRGRVARGDPWASLEVAIATRHPWSSTERDLIKRGRALGLLDEGGFTEAGRNLLETVDRAKVAVLAVLDELGERTMWMLHDALKSGFSSDTIDAAIDDLAAGGRLSMSAVLCPSCGEHHDGARIVAGGTPPSSASSRTPPVEFLG